MLKLAGAMHMDDLLFELDFSDLHSFDDDSPPPELLLDVPYVPTDMRIVRAMLDLAAVTPSDLLYDLGCGDGRIVVTAALERGAHGIGIDIDPMRIADAMELAGDSRVEHMTDFIEGDLLEVDFADATVVLLYLLDLVNLQIRPRLLNELQPGTRIVSQTFDMADWKPDRQLRLDSINLFQWWVPAPVAGTWQWENRDGNHYRVTLRQHFQKLSGQAWLNGKEVRLHRARLQGDLLDLGIKPRQQNSSHDFILRWERGQLHPVDDAGLLPSVIRPGGP